MNSLYDGADRLLGQRVDYPEEYAPECLVRVARIVNPHSEWEGRMLGVDVWHAYEVSALVEGGLPVAGILKIVYPADSPFIVESKSLKLYLHSLNSLVLGSTRGEVAERIAGIVSHDLTELLQTQVHARLHFEVNAPSPFQSRVPIEDSLCQTDAVGLGEADPEHWNCPLGAAFRSESFSTHLLRSNCPITRQPDWGSLFIDYQAERTVRSGDLLAYLLSLRTQAHFHEQICQQVFCVLAEALNPRSLCVAALYLRRGGIDINPVRALTPKALPELFVSADYFTEPLLRQ